MRARRVPPNSWFHPEGARVLGGRLACRLQKRFPNGCKMITLTYDRTRWKNASELYYAQVRDEHVNRFMRELARRMGVSFTGRWCRKMEFHTQNDNEGWLHWHVMLDWRAKLPLDVVRECWKFGTGMGIDVKHVPAANVGYAAKYVVKDFDDLPAWLLHQPQRSVKVFACSSGFWKSVEGGDDDVSSIPFEHGDGRSLCVVRDDVDLVDRLPVYRTIGDVLDDDRELLEVEVVHHRHGEAQTCRYRFDIPFVSFCSWLDSFDESEAYRIGHPVQSRERVSLFQSDDDVGTSDVPYDVAHRQWLSFHVADVGSFMDALRTLEYVCVRERQGGGEPKAADALALAQQPIPRKHDVPKWLLYYFQRLDADDRRAA